MLECDRFDISEGIDINKVNHQNSIKLVIIVTLKILVVNMNHIFAIVVLV